MSERRMFAKSIIDTDAFLELPLSAQALYFHLSMRADDEGFVSKPKSVQRLIRASDDDFKLLIAKRYILIFDTGVIVIKHWKIHNYIRGDRLQKTNYRDEREKLVLQSNGAYTEADGDKTVPIQSLKTLGNTECQSSDSQMSGRCQSSDSIGKNSIGKVSIDKDKYICAFNEFWKNYPRKKDKARAYKCYCARLNDGYTEDQLLVACINYAAECEHNKTEERYIKHGATFLSVNEPFLDYLKGETGYVGMGTDASRDEAEYERQVREQLKRIESGEFDNENLWE